MRWEISDQDIETTEEIILGHGAHFQDDAREVIRCWHSANIAACPGSGKTTVLLAKLKLLADRMPLENGAGICVLSHTNIAVDEIKNRLFDYKDKLLGYPNYIGTIQSFIDKFVTMPYLRNIAGRNVQVVDNFTYAQYMLGKIQHNSKYRSLDYVTRNNFETGGQFAERISHTQALYIREDGALCVGRQKKALAGKGKASAEQYKNLLRELLKDEGIIRYQDAYSYANTAIDELPPAYTELFSSRFRYVFIDEYQDCDRIQRQAIDSIFDAQKCSVFKIGDSDQAIYNSSKDTTQDWTPQSPLFSIMTSCRFNQEIADVICKLRKGNKQIKTLVGKTGIKPVLIVFSPEKINRVISTFISVLDEHGIYDNNGIYKAIGAVKKEDTAGLKIGDYWGGFDGSAKVKNENTYWFFVDEISKELSNGQLYKAEQTVRKLLCRVLHHIGVKNPLSGKEYTPSTIKKTLNAEYKDLYRQWIYEMSNIQNIERESIDLFLREQINKLIRIKNPEKTDIFVNLPKLFLDEGGVNIHIGVSASNNILIDADRGRRIVFDTIHAVKGETHDVTLYLETDRQGGSDLNRILPFFGVGKQGTSNLYDYSRKLAYVGMSRPRKLLCVAMQAKTYERCHSALANDWEVIFLKDDGE